MTELTKENFEIEVERAEGLVVIDLWAEWCGPCKLIAPIIDELEGEIPEAKFCKINVDNEPELTKMFKVNSIPTIALVKNNTFLDLSVGYVTKDKLKAFIVAHI